MSAVPKPSLVALTPMQPVNLPAIAAIEQAIYEFPWTQGNFRDSIDAGYACWEYRAGTTLIGYAVMMMAVDEAHLLNLTIAAPFQRRGHGARLLEALFDSARRAGASAMVLEVRPSNAGGRALYARMGFTQIGARRGYYPAVRGREDALILHRAL